jgi:hypothetical protein
MKTTLRLFHRAVSSSTALPSRSSGAALLGTAFRAFVAGCTAIACDAALDDYIVLTHALQRASARSTIDNDERLRTALGESYVPYDGAWWNASVSRIRRSEVARVTFAARGERAACDITVVMVGRNRHTRRNDSFERGLSSHRENGRARSSSSSSSGSGSSGSDDAKEEKDAYAWMRFVPSSVAHALVGAEFWEVASVDASLPTDRGGGRSALVSLMITPASSLSVSSGEGASTEKKSSLYGSNAREQSGKGVSARAK